MSKKAFTLIELLVVVAIIGILAAVGVVAYNGYTSAAKVSATKANHKMITKMIGAKGIQCNIGGSVEYTDINGSKKNMNCPVSIDNFISFMNQTIYSILQFRHLKFKTSWSYLLQCQLCFNMPWFIFQYFLKPIDGLFELSASICNNT